VLLADPVPGRSGAARTAALLQRGHRLLRPLHPSDGPSPQVPIPIAVMVATPVKAYGLTLQWDGFVETEAAVLREAACRVIAGDRLASIARDLRSRGIPSPTGRLWTDATLGRLLRNPRLVGDRAYNGQVVARDCWPAILDGETFARLQLTLNHPARQGAPPRHHKRLATGFARCGLCGQNMSTTTRSGQRYYSCPTQPTGCRRIHVRADRLEAWLLDQLRLEPPPAALDADPGATATAMAELYRERVDQNQCAGPFRTGRRIQRRHRPSQGLCKQHDTSRCCWISSTSRIGDRSSLIHCSTCARRRIRRSRLAFELPDRRGTPSVLSSGIIPHS
jgi:hypothetical protein